MIRSLSCKVRYQDGTFKDSFIHLNPYFSWVGDQPRNLAWPEIERFSVEEEREVGATGT